MRCSKTQFLIRIQYLSSLTSDENSSNPGDPHSLQVEATWTLAALGGVNLTSEKKELGKPEKY